MSNYTVTTNFLAKDSLPSGDSGKVIKGADHQTEYNNIATAVNSKADSASPTFTGTITLPGTVAGSPTASGTWTFSNLIVGQILPAGVIMQYGGSAAPTGWLLCDGSAVSRTTYSALFTSISTTYGTGDGSTTFNVPNFLGRVIVGAGAGTTVETLASQTPSSNQVLVASNTDKWLTGMQITISASTITGLSNGTTHYIIRVNTTTISFASSLANALSGTVESISGTGVATLTYTLTTRSLGGIGGEETHAVTINEMPIHTHTQNPHNHGIDTWGGNGSSSILQSDGSTSPHGVVTSQSTTATNNNTGGSAAHNNMQPYGIATYIIKT